MIRPAQILAILTLASAPAAAAEVKPFTHVSKTKYAEIDFSWSSEAAAVPALVRRFKSDLAKTRARMESCGKAESAARIATGGQAIACASSTKITTSGQTPRLLSLARAGWAFTGGAHGNGATTAIPWDRRAAREISFGSLFQKTGGFAPILRTPYCQALARERKKRRGSDYQPGSIAEFDSCPQFSDLALIPAASPRSGRFDKVRLIAAPYLAGSFAEGEYAIALPVTPRLIAALKPEFRASFAAQPQ